MPFPVRSFRDRRPPTVSLILLIAFAAITGCGNDNSSGGTSGAADWLVVPSGGQHAKSATRDYLADSDKFRCGECHGADLSGGTSQVSCVENTAGCHHDPVSGWVATSPAPQNHGVSAKQLPGSSSFVSCQICHGRYFSGGDSTVSCFPCHEVNAPHPPGPWRGPTYTHINTNTENAQVCAQCHFPGSPNNPSNHPATPAEEGTPPGCFNSTLCHGDTAAPHALGTSWRDPNPQFHGLTAKQDLAHCQGCHGAPGTTLFDGGTASTSCQTSTCHARAKAHPIPWYQASQPFPGYVVSHRDSGNRDVACAICHNTDGPGTGADPSAPSCSSTSFSGVLCHSAGGGGANHPVPFPGAIHTSTDQTSFNADCSACHAITGASPNSIAPLCTLCHQSMTTLPFTNCTSCHTRPPSGTDYPDVAGGHARHDALANVTGVCDTCHNGLGSGTAGHYDRANARPGKDALRVPPGDVVFLATYNAKAGPAAFDDTTLACGNVSCHGGVTTPNWQTATANAIDVPNACLSCHVSGTSQYNSYFSGQHDRHLNAFGLSATACKQCHDVAKVNVSGHFQNLATPAFEQPAAETILPAVGYNGMSCDPNKGGLTGCHKKENW
jgi:predicted CxxxxCH...CXXCH cytochrome family protein